MRPRRAGDPAVPLRPYLVALVMMAALAVVTYFAFHPSLPFVDGYRIEAVFQSSNGLRTGSPVRIAGIDVGKVVDIKNGPGNTTVAVLEIKDGGRPVHRDATAHIRARVFLEGGFLVELRPGSPSAPELRSLVVRYPEPVARPRMSTTPAPSQFAPSADEAGRYAPRSEVLAAQAAPPVPAAEREATLETGGFQAVFRIPGRISVAASEGAKSFRIATGTIAPELLVRATPALD